MLTLSKALPGTARRDAIITTSLDGRVLFWSPGAEGLLGYTERGVVGRPIRNLLPGKYQRLDQLNVDEVAEGATVRNILVKHRTAGGDTVRCLQTMIPIRDTAGKIVAALRIIVDLSSTLAVRQAMQRNVDQLDEIAADASLTSAGAPHASQATRYYRKERLRTIRDYLSVVEAESLKAQEMLDELRGKAAALDNLLATTTTSLEPTPPSTPPSRTVL